MERNLTILLMLFAFLTAISALTTTTPLYGLSTILGVSVLGSSVLGSSVLGSSVLGSSVLASTTIVEAYTGAVVMSQLWFSLVAIGLLAYLELSNPSHEKRVQARSTIAKPSQKQRQLCSIARINVFSELRRSWLPVSTLLVVLFFIIVALKVWRIIAC